MQLWITDGNSQSSNQKDVFVELRKSCDYVIWSMPDSSIFWEGVRVKEDLGLGLQVFLDVDDTLVLEAAVHGEVVLAVTLLGGNADLGIIPKLSQLEQRYISSKGVSVLKLIAPKVTCFVIFSLFS